MGALGDFTLTPPRVAGLSQPSQVDTDLSRTFFEKHVEPTSPLIMSPALPFDPYEMFYKRDFYDRMKDLKQLNPLDDSNKHEWDDQTPGKHVFPLFRIHFGINRLEPVLKSVDRIKVVVSDPGIGRLVNFKAAGAGLSQSTVTPLAFRGRKSQMKLVSYSRKGCA